MADVDNAAREGAVSRPPAGETLIALGVLALSAVAFWQTLVIPVSPLYARVGPTVIPMIAASGLGLCGLALLALALRGGWQDEEEKATPPDLRALLLLGCGRGLHGANVGTGREAGGAEGKEGSSESRTH